MFGARNFITVMAGLGLFDNKAILQEYNFLSGKYIDFANQSFNNIVNDLNSTQYISHKQFLKEIREGGKS
jgi:hypothetical protein